MSLGVVRLAVASAIGLPTALVVLAAALQMYRQLKGAYALGFGAAWRVPVVIAKITSALFHPFLFWIGN